MTTLGTLTRWAATLTLAWVATLAIVCGFLARAAYKPTPVPPRRPAPAPPAADATTRPPHHHPHPSTHSGAGAGHLTPDQHAILDTLDAEFDDLLTILDRTSNETWAASEADDWCPPHGIRRPDTPPSN